MGIVYKFTSPNNKGYIGQTIHTFETRTSGHVSRAKKAEKCNFEIQGCEAFWRAIIKYGINNFQTEILIECDNSELDKYEQEFIKLHRTLSPNGYNLTSGGNSNKIISEATRQKISRNVIKAMERLGTLLKRSENSKGLPMYIGYYSYRARYGFRIQAHKKCSHKEFDVKLYGTLELAKAAAIDYMEKIDSGEIEHRYKKRGEGLETGITEVLRGYRVQLFKNKIKYVRCFYNKKRSQIENLKLAREYLQTVHDGTVIPKKPNVGTLAMPIGITARGPNGFRVRICIGRVEKSKTITSLKNTREENFQLALKALKEMK